MHRLPILIFALIGLLFVTGPIEAQVSEPSPEKLRALAELFSDPEIRAWLQTQIDNRAVAAAAAAPADAGRSIQHAVSDRIGTTRSFIRALAATVPSVPEELGRAWERLRTELREQGLLGAVLPLALFAALGFGLEWLFWWATSGFRRRMIAIRLETVHDRLRVVWLRSIYGLGVLLAFAAGSVGAFLLFDWPPLLQEIVLSYLVVFLILRLVLVLGRIVLAPGAERFRLVPMATTTARFWFVWSAVLVGWFFFVKLTLDLLTTLGVGREAWYLVGLSCGLVLLGLALFVVWCSPAFDGSDRASRGHRVGSWLLSLYLLVVWLLLFTGSVTPFYIGVVLLLLPILIGGSHLAVNHVLRPVGGAASEPALSSVVAVSLERGLRAVLLIGGALLIAWLLELDVDALTARDTLAIRLLRGAINAVIVALLADFAWHVLRTWIDRRIAEADNGGQGEGDKARRHARLRTLLPILKNALFVILVVMATLVALAALGVEIGPLIAGAGVIGLAVGFGAQTLVKDVISGMFFLLDDAFRVGEYIESGSIRGTVEGFSLRSIKLRHHRGALHTVPFGSLEKITNYSRDWVIDKITVNVTYDTDPDKVKKIIKEIGKELQADPEFAPHILETLKMQGVEQFGDFAVQLRLKMTTKPGEQFVIRRRAYALIKKAFDANGINFAFPTVQVAGGQAAAAAAQQALGANRPPSPA